MSRIFMVDAHDPIPTEHTDKAGFLSTMSAEMLMILNTRRELDTLSERISVQITLEIHPFATIFGPGFAAKCFYCSLKKQFLFQNGEMFADHER